MPWLRRSLVLLLLGVGSLTVGDLVLRPAARSAAQPESPAKPSRELPQVVCLGHVDVDGGLIALVPARSGRVVALNVEEGETVRAGALLLRQDDRPARLEVEQLRSALDVARVRVQKAEQDRRLHPARVAQQMAAVTSAEYRVTTARHQLERQQELFKIHHTSQPEVQAAESQVKDFDAQAQVTRERLAELNLFDPELAVREAQAEVTVAEAKLHQAEYAVEQCELRAPGAGTVLRVQTGPGEVVGTAGGVAPFLFCPDKPLIVRAEVEQEFVRRIAVGQRAKVEDESPGGAAWTGHVARIAAWYAQRKSALEKPSAFKDVPTVECVIRLDETRPGLRIGQRVQVTITQENR